MSIENAYSNLIKCIPKEKVLKNEIMSKHTSFKVGGPADLFITVETTEQLKDTIKILKHENIKYKVIGNGSNLLVKDEGYRGAIIKPSFNSIEIKEDIVEAGAGVKNGRVAQKWLQKELTGCEFAAGIPGTIGGAMVMNAGAHGREMKDIVDAVTYYNCENDEIETIKKEECNFEYRNSKFKNSNVIIIKAILKLQKANSIEIKQKMDEYKQFRIEKQPIEYPSAGSTFKRGADFITAKLIDEAGLKGYTVGGAQVSEKHAGFIINKNNATATDIINLIEEVQKIVYEKFNKKIELEIEII